VGTFVVKLQADAYVVWSNTVDAPVSPILDRPGLTRHLIDRLDISQDMAESLLRNADANGTSAPGVTLDEVIRTNRAGPGESRLTLAELLGKYR
jgi:hypothetical protein